MTNQLGYSDIKAAYSHCGTITRREARNFYYAFLTLPKKQRQAVYAAYAFSREADDIADGNAPPQDKAQALALLRQRLRKAFRGEPDGPILMALADASSMYGIPEQYFHHILDGVEMDVATRRYETFDDLRSYCYRVASAVGLISIHVFGYHGEEAKSYAVDFGLAMQLTNILRDLREDIDRDRVYLPQVELRRFGYSEEKLRAGVVDASFNALMRFQVDRTRGYFASGERLLPLLHPRSRPCAMGLWQLYSRLLDRIESRGFDVFTERISLPTCEKLQLTCKLWATNFIPQRN